MNPMRALLRARWNVLRLAVALFLLWAVASDTPARLARMQYAALPDFDYAAEVRYLRTSGRYGEALVVADAALDAARAGDQSISPEEAAAIVGERQKTVDDQGSYLRRVKDLGLGALSGGGSGGSLEMLVGAVAADFFIVGDVRDLVLQGGRLVLDGETDEVILLLSGVGLATTLAPEVDWVPSILKAARRTGSMTRGMSEFLVAAIKAGRFDELGALMRNVRALSSAASPGGAVRLLKHADTPQDVAKLARFVEREKGAAFALHVTGREGVDVIKAAGDAGTARVVILAGRKGEAGALWLRAGAWRALVRPHVLVGALKAIYKGNADDLVRRVAEAIDPRARWIVAALAAWVFLEGVILLGRLRRARAPATHGAQPAPTPAG